MKRILANLRERPEDERKTVAAGVALATVGILFVGWGYSFVQGLGSGTSVVAQNPAGQPSANTAAVQTSQQPAQAGTSTNPSDSLYYSITQ